MDAAEILKRAWASVEASGVPESLQETALREAVAIIRDGERAPPSDRQQASGAKGGGAGRSTQPAARRAASGRKAATKATSDGASIEVPDEAAFFGNLADEAGVDETRLRNIMRLQQNGAVVVTPATRKLGTSKAAQARTVVALVAPARLYGLGENPINADAVRAECTRKNCFDQKNFGSKVVGPLGGVNYGGVNTEIVLTVKWVDEFRTAVVIANGDSSEED